MRTSVHYALGQDSTYAVDTALLDAASLRIELFISRNEIKQSFNPVGDAHNV